MSALRPVGCLLVLALVACRDDASSKDAAVDKSAATDQLSVDRPGTVDQKTTAADAVVVPDKPATVDQAKVDGAGAATLTSTHVGWSKASCTGTGCHSASGHTGQSASTCAACHGGNGACNPNGPSSSFKTHSKTSTCTSCHSAKHGFSAKADCVACHYASAGIADCN